MNNLPDPKREKELFEQALEMTSPPERAAFLKGACVGDPVLRQRLEALLRAAEAPAPILAPAPREEPDTVLGATALLEGPGSLIGRFKLLGKLGEGGFGAVYVAEQREPGKRRVALKLIKLGMDTKQVVARFYAFRAPSWEEIK